MEVNFKANLLSKTYVRRYNPVKNKYVPREVSFLEINSREKSDIKALKKLKNLWKEGIFADKIYYYAQKNPKIKTYILTTQEDNFDCVDEKRILGVAQLSKEAPDQYCLEYMETNPKYQYSNDEREYKFVGKRTLHSLKKVFYDKKIRVNYLFDKIEFYMNNGFNFVSDLFGDLVWEAQKRK